MLSSSATRTPKRTWNNNYLITYNSQGCIKRIPRSRSGCDPQWNLYAIHSSTVSNRCDKNLRISVSHRQLSLSLERIETKRTNERKDERTTNKNTRKKGWRVRSNVIVVPRRKTTPSPLISKKPLNNKHLRVGMDGTLLLTWIQRKICRWIIIRREIGSKGRFKTSLFSLSFFKLARRNKR